MQEIFNRKLQNTKHSKKYHSHAPKWKKEACQKKSYASKERVWTAQNSKVMYCICCH